MIKIRLQRRGRRKRPIHHIVVADSRSPRDGRIIEDIGRLDNLKAHDEVKLDKERALHWLQKGAQPSDTVRSILKKQGVMYRLHLIRWGKSDEEIEEALAEWGEKRAEKEAEQKEPTKKEQQQAMLDAEEREYQKQLKKKAEEAAKEKAKQEALAKKEKEEAKKAAEEEEAKQADNSSEENEAAAQADQASDDEQQATDSSDDDSDEETADSAEDESPEAAEDDETEANAEAAKEDETDDADDAQKSSGKKDSTDMLAKEAIDHIEETPLDELKGFVTDDEDRVTVIRAWEEKQENS